MEPPGWTVLGVPIDSVGAPAGGPRTGTERAPDVLRDNGIAERLGAEDRGCIRARVVGPQRDPATGLVGGTTVHEVVRQTRAAVDQVLLSGRRPLVVGGCCTLLMGALPAARDRLGPLGLAYVDGHLDLYDQVTSPTGEAADMPVAVLLGVGEPGLLAAAGPVPALTAEHLRIIGARDPQEVLDVGVLADRLGVHSLSPDRVRATPEAVAAAAIPAVCRTGAFWLHVDVDVLDQEAFPATDYLLPGGLEVDELADVLRPLGRDEHLVGASVACYNPDKDPDGRYGRLLTDLVVDVLGGHG